MAGVSDQFSTGEQGNLKDTLLENCFKGSGQVEVLDGQFLTEDAVDIALGVVNGHIVFTNDNQAVAMGYSVVGA